jgi:diguanylate cyclase (GGDEF)-like protein
VAQRDALTGLANRRLFEVNIGNAEQNQKALNSGFTVMLMDLNKFKYVNDTFGHEAGDVVLKVVGQRLKKLMRPSDTLARLGGDEFAVLMRTTDLQPVTDLATAIVHAVQQPIAIQNGQTVQVGTSIGIAFSPQHSTIGSEVMHHADLTMYAAKKQGGGFLIAESPTSA